MQPDGFTRKATIRLAAARVALVVASLGGLVAAMNVVDYVPTADGPQHILGAWAHDRIDDPALDYGAWIMPNWPPSSAAFTWLFRLAALWASWKGAAAFATTGCALLWAVGFSLVAAARGVDRLAGAVLGAATALGFVFYIGALSFLAGAGLALAAIAVSLGERGSARSAVVALVLLLAAHAHVYAAVVGGLVIASVALARAPAAATVVRLTFMGAPALVLCLVVLSYGGLPSETSSIGQGVSRWPLMLSGVLGGPLWRSLGIYALTLAAGALALVRGRDVVDRALAVTGFVLVASGLVIPLHAFGWELVGTRAVPMGFAVLVASCPWERLPRRVGLLASVVVIAFSAASLWWSAELHRTVHAQMRDMLSPLDEKLPTVSGYRWPIITWTPEVAFDAGLLGWNPATNIGQLYAVVQGGWVAEAFAALPSAHSVLLRPRTLPRPIPKHVLTALPWYTDADKDRALRDAIQVSRRFPDGIIVVAVPEDLDRWVQAGFQVILRRGAFMLARPPVGAGDAPSRETGK